jgi:electron transport complex protein RnfB
MCEAEHIDRMIIPPAEAQQIVAHAGQAYLRNCVCRTREQACSPEAWEVCLLFEHASADDLRQARPIPTREALAILKASEEQGLINQLFYAQNGQYLTEVCSCCTCCCGPLRRIKEESRYADELRSGYAAVTDPELCLACGLCLDACFFEARCLENGRLTLRDDLCFGCGRCVGSCPEGAIRVELLTDRNVPALAYAKTENWR